MAGASVPVVNIPRHHRSSRLRTAPTASGAIAGAVPPAMRPAGMSRDDYATRNRRWHPSSGDQPQVGINKPMDRLLAYQRHLGPQGRIVDVEVSKRTGRLITAVNAAR